MAPRQFVLIEHSLRRLGGHYFHYATQVLAAAERAGMQPVLGINREFRDLDRFPVHWRVLPVFRNRAQRLHRTGRGPLGALLRLWKQLRVRGQQRRSMAEFELGCAEFFAQVQLSRHDVVYFSTIGDLDLLALARFLAARPDTAVADWHLQFHNPVYAGRDPEFAAQEPAVRGLRQRFAAVRAQLPRHRLTCHTTSEALTRQYHSIGEVTARTLPWPVAVPRFGDPARPAGDPLRLVLPGALRREKGSREFKPMFVAVQRQELGARRIQFVVQCSDKRREQDLGGLPLAAVGEADLLGARLPETPIVALPHPLGDEAYERLIQTADLGVMIYGADEYFARASGILAEFLAAGVPVLVPAGTWLSDQIQGPNDQHLAALAGSGLAQQRWQVRGAEHELRFERAGAALLVRLQFAPAQPPGCYARIAVQPFDHDGKPLPAGDAVMAARPAPQPQPAALFALDPRATGVRLQLTQAFHDSTLALAGVEAVLLSGDRAPPRGALGVAVAAPEQVPQAIAELVRHHDHYRAAARAFAATWLHAHAPDRSIEILTGQASGPPV